MHPAYEDIHYYLWRERRLPANVLAEDAKLRDELERARLARVFGQGLASPVGSVLPLRRAVRDGVRIWQGGKWFFRGGALFLIPGDSPIGLRLPLDSLPWADPDEIEPEIEPDPFAPRPPLPPRQASPCRGARPSDGRGRRRVPPDAAGRAGDRPRRARPGAHRALRRAAQRADPRLPAAARTPPRTGWRWSPRSRTPPRRLGRKVVLEGYLPPHDPRLQHFSVTPDPGVIEVNIHPAHNWPELVRARRGSSTRKRARSGWPRKSSCWTAAMSAPAAATTW